jgi:hypothetical protein
MFLEADSFLQMFLEVFPWLFVKRRFKLIAIYVFRFVKPRESAGILPLTFCSEMVFNWTRGQLLQIADLKNGGLA